MVVGGDRPVSETHWVNANVLFSPEGEIVGEYRKQHPVPFGEYIPLRELLLPFIDRLKLVGRETYAGDEPGLMQIAGVRVGAVICFEIAYDEIVRGVQDSQVFVVQSNNATFQGTGMPEQQFAITRLRAIEYGKATLVATPSGLSGVIAPDGTVVARSGESTREIFVEEVPLRSEPTLAAELGQLPELVLSGVAVLALAASVVAWRQSRRTPKVSP